MKITDGGNDTFTPVTFPDAPSYSYMQVGDTSAGPGCGTTFNSGYNLNLLIGSMDLPPGLPNCAVTPVNDCPP